MPPSPRKYCRLCSRLTLSWLSQLSRNWKHGITLSDVSGRCGLNAPGMKPRLPRGRYAPGIVPLPETPEYYGEQGIVSEPGREVLSFELNPYSAGCCSPVFVGKLSEDGERLTGGWDGVNAPGSREW